MTNQQNLTPPTTGQKISKGVDVVATGVSIVARVIVSLLWAAVGVAVLLTGAHEMWWVPLVCAAYLAYLWIFRGRWLIY